MCVPPGVSAVHGCHVAVPGLDPAAVATARHEAASVLLWTLPRLYSPTLVCARVSRYRRYRESHSRTMVVQVVASMRHALAVASSDQTLHMLEFLKVCGRSWSNGDVSTQLPWRCFAGVEWVPSLS